MGIDGTLYNSALDAAAEPCARRGDLGRGDLCAFGGCWHGTEAAREVLQPDRDLCFAVVNRSGAVSLEISTFARYFDRYALCVEPPRGANTCRSFPIRKVGAFYISRVRWHRNFPPRGQGVYIVSWKLKTNPLGPRLKFRLPLS